MHAIGRTAFRFHRAARAEAKVAAERCATISPWLGLRFYDLVYRLVREVCAQPTLDRAFDSPARRHFCRPFLPAVIDIHRPDHVRIAVVAPLNMRSAKKSALGSTRSTSDGCVGSTRFTSDGCVGSTRSTSDGCVGSTRPTSDGCVGSTRFTSDGCVGVNALHLAWMRWVNAPHLGWMR
jgi:hypothetical protein